VLGRKVEKLAGTKSCRLRQTVDLRTERDILSSQHDPLARVISGASDTVSAHAATLNRATASQLSRARPAMLRLQRQYGNHYVQRVMPLSRKADGGAEATPVLQRKQTKGSTPAPTTQAVVILKTSGKMGIGTTALSTNLVHGIIKAESRFMGLLGGLAESMGIGDTRGPGQIGKAAVDRVDANFAAEISQFAKVFSGPPASWEDKVTDSNWSYFYIAGYLACRINEAQGTFQVSDNDSAINYGIAMYHGAYRTIKKYRRALAKKRGITNLRTITWKMLVKEVEKSEKRTITIVGGIASAFTPRIVEIVNYVHTARGLPDVSVRTEYIPLPGGKL
jgi:hypothetical protein